MVASDTDEARDPGPQGWCGCGQKVTIADTRELNPAERAACLRGPLPRLRRSASPLI